MTSDVPTAPCDWPTFKGTGSCPAKGFIPGSDTRQDSDHQGSDTRQDTDHQHRRPTWAHSNIPGSDTCQDSDHQRQPPTWAHPRKPSRQYPDWYSTYSYPGEGRCRETNINISTAPVRESIPRAMVRKFFSTFGSSMGHVAVLGTIAGGNLLSGLTGFAVGSYLAKGGDCPGSNGGGGQISDGGRRWSSSFKMGY